MTRRKTILFIFAMIAATGLSLQQAQAAGEPTIASATTADNGDGFLDAVTVTFSSAMEASTPGSHWFAADPSQDGFYVANYEITGATWLSATPATGLRLALRPKTTPDTGATPQISYKQVSNGPRGAGTLAPLAAGAVTPNDGAGPVLTQVQAYDSGAVNLFNASGDRVVISFSEPVRLAGVGTTRLNNLEAALRFTGILSEGANGCPVDGKALQDNNFPQQSTGESPIEPATAADLNSKLTVTMRQGNIPSVQRFVGVPRGCSIGVEPSSNSVITDGAGNVARPLNVISGRSIVARVEPLPLKVVRIATTDGVGSVPDGIADGIRVTFDQPLNDSTLGAFASTQITHLESPINIDAVSTGSTANDAVVDFKVNVPPSAAAADIRASFSSPGCTHSPTGTSTNGPAGPVPYGSGFAACVASFDSVVEDGVGPAILVATTRDVDLNGHIDGATLTFSEPLATASSAGWSLGSSQATEFIVDETDATKATLVIAEGNSPNGGATPAVTYVRGSQDQTADNVGNQVPAASWPTVDGVGPAIASATMFDSNANGHIDRIEMTLSEPATASSPQISFGAFEANSVSVDGDRVIASFSGETGSATAPLLASGMSDVLGHAVTAAPFLDLADTVAPFGVIQVSPSAPIPAGDATVRVIFTEDMRQDPLEVTFEGSPVDGVVSANHSDGWKIDDPAVWEGSIVVSEDACSNSTGCPVEIRAQGGSDIEGIAQLAALTLNTFVDVIAPDAAPISSVRGLGTSMVPPNVVNAESTNFSVVADLPQGQADGGSVEVLIDGGSMNIPMVATIPAGASSIKLDSIYDNKDDLRAALGGEGNHFLSIRLCDSASNCVVGPDSDVLVDTIPVSVSLDSPSENELLKGGSKIALAWTATNLVDVDGISLQYSTTYGRSWQTIVSGITDSGTYEWNVPMINRNKVRLRAVSVDQAWNQDLSVASGTLDIDSRKPVIRRFVVPGRGYLKAGRSYTVKWQIRDLTLDRSDTPIRLLQSTNGGRSYKAINGGRASTLDDNRESWRVPRGKGRTYLRIIATDAVGHRVVSTLKMMRCSNPKQRCR